MKTGGFMWFEELRLAVSDPRFWHLFAVIASVYAACLVVLYCFIDQYGKRDKLKHCVKEPRSNKVWWMYAVVLVPQTNHGATVSLQTIALLIGICVFLIGIYLIRKALLLNKDFTKYTDPRKTLLSFKKTANNELQRDGIQKIADCFDVTVSKPLSGVLQAERLIRIVTLTREHGLDDHREFLTMLYRIAEYQNDILLASTLNAVHRIEK